jgi:hypothetical protein
MRLAATGLVFVAALLGGAGSPELQASSLLASAPGSILGEGLRVVNRGGSCLAG